LSSMIPPPPTPTLFPYTTLFRSTTQAHLGVDVDMAADVRGAAGDHGRQEVRGVLGAGQAEFLAAALAIGDAPGQGAAAGIGHPRSEEHTSELQSRFDLVCRLLLE